MKQSIGSWFLDILTGGEHRENLKHALAEHLIDLYRGESYPSFTGLGTGTATVQIPGAPNGYAWAIRLVSVQVSAVANVSVYPGENTNVAPIGLGVTQANGGNNECVIQPSNRAVVFADQRVITVVASAGNITTWRLSVKQVPAEMIGKL